MDKIFFNQLTFYGYHGVYPEENKLGQRFIIDLELRLDLTQASITDDIDQTVDYGDVYRMVKREVEETEFKLLERLADHIASKILAYYSIPEVWIRVTKPNPPIPGQYQSVGVELVRSKKGTQK